MSAAQWLGAVCHWSCRGVTLGLGECCPVAWSRVSQVLERGITDLGEGCHRSWRGVSQVLERSDPGSW